MTLPRISILLPTWNGERDLRRLLPALASQVCEGERELLAVDSSSTDASVELLRAAGAEVEVIPQAEFGHGKTRNALARRARGEFLVFLSQDVLPAREDFLAQLLRPLEDARVAGAYARILPHPEDDPLTARTVLHAPEARAEAPAQSLLNPEEVWELPPRERAERLRFNNVASVVRAEVFHLIDFPDVPFGEDFAWAARVLTAGHEVRFAPGSVVHHAHRYTAREAFERYRLDAAFHREIHGLRLRASALAVLRGFGFELREDLRYILREEGARGLIHLLRSPGLRAAQVLGQYWGSRGWGPEFWPKRSEGEGPLGGRSPAQVFAAAALPDRTLENGSQPQQLSDS
jgi:rhamnosyltransferase